MNVQHSCGEDVVVEARTNRTTGGRVLLMYMPGEDPSCRWQTDCMLHARNCGHRTRRVARSFMAVPWEWCEDCADGAPALATSEREEH